MSSSITSSITSPVRFLNIVGGLLLEGAEHKGGGAGCGDLNLFLKTWVILAVTSSTQLESKTEVS